MPKNVFMLSVSFTGSYIEDEPNFPPRNNLISQKIVWRKQGTEFQGTFQDLIKKSLQVFFKDFSRRLLKFQTFSRLYEPFSFGFFFSFSLPLPRSLIKPSYSTIYTYVHP